MSEQKPIKFADLARRWGFSRPYIRKLVTEKGLPCSPDGGPAFTSLEEADAWLTENVATRKPPITSEKNPAEVGGKNARVSGTTTSGNAKRPDVDAAAPEKPGGQGAPGGHDGEGEDGAAGPEDLAQLRQRAPRGALPLIDVEKFIRRDKDFDSLMLEHAERVPQIAFGLLEMKQRTGVPTAIANATENWHQAVKAAAQVREKFLDVQERTRALIQLDQVMDVVGTELQALRTALMKLGERVAAKANPDNPALAQTAIDAAVDDVFRQTSVLEERTRKELSG